MISSGVTPCSLSCVRSSSVNFKTDLTKLGRFCFLFFVVYTRSYVG